MRLVGDSLAQRGEDPRLADAGLAGEQHDLAFTRARVPPALDEQRDFGLASDERRHPLRTRGFEAAHVLCLAQDRPGGRGRAEPFQIEQSERFDLEGVAQKTPGRVGDQDRAGLGAGLQARGQIGRVAYNGLFLRRPLADQIADDDDPRRDADAHIQSFSDARVEPPDGVREVEPRANSSFGVVLVGARKAEIGEDSIAHEFRHEAIVARDDARAGLLIAANDLAHVLGVEPRRKGG